MMNIKRVRGAFQSSWASRPGQKLSSPDGLGFSLIGGANTSPDPVFAKHPLDGAQVQSSATASLGLSLSQTITPRTTPFVAPGAGQAASPTSSFTASGADVKAFAFAPDAAVSVPETAGVEAENLVKDLASKTNPVRDAAPSEFVLTNVLTGDLSSATANTFAATATKEPAGSSIPISQDATSGAPALVSNVNTLVNTEAAAIQPGDSPSAIIAPNVETAGVVVNSLAAPANVVPNKIAIENAKQGNPESEWGINGDGDSNIQGFATEISTNIGGTVDFKIATGSTNYRIDIYRLGYYGGDGARLIDSVDVNLATAQDQPHPLYNATTGLIDCANWDVSASWGIPADAVSGLYIAKLVREDGTEGASHIPFIVRDDSSTSDIVFQTSDTTWQAYNAWGGTSLYEGNVPVDPEDMIGWTPPNCSCGLNAVGRAQAVSYNRPFVTQESTWGGPHDYIFGAEYAAIRWLEQNGYDISYISGVDATRNGANLLNHEAFLSVGHDEYWSAEQRANVEAARDSGVNLAFWSGNEMYWKVRWETDAEGNSYRTMVCYKETWGLAEDPSGISTGTWRDPRYADPGQEPENALTGTMFSVDSYRLDTITVSSDFSNLRFWRDTAVADLEDGEVYSLPKNLLGYEWDSDVENGFRPAGLINMSLSTVAVEQYLRDYGTRIGAADAQHSLTMYRAESGALVFGAGTVFWSWGLDDQHSGEATPVDRNVQQAMVNMFADMGIQPTTLQASLILATQSTDLAKPTSTITTPLLSASFVEGQRVTITGTAVDFGGGAIAGVEVSVDGGQSWFKAAGRDNWTYNWVVQASGNYKIMSRAVDDSLNLETPGAGQTVAVGLPSTSSLWTMATKPAEETTLDPDGVELGVKFQTSTAGTVDAIRFFKGFYNIGVHTVSLWTAAGQLIATGVSSGESLSGWQTVQFSTPVTIDKNTTYIASYHTNGYYSTTDNYFQSGYTNGLLSVQAGAGVYAYGATSTAPLSAAPHNYWVDVVFTPEPNLAPVAVDDNNLVVGQGGILTIPFAVLTANDTDANGEALTVSAVSNAVNGTVTIDSVNGNVIFTPNPGYNGPAQFDYTVSDTRGATDVGRANVTVDAAPAGVSLFGPSESPAGANMTGGSVELGMRFVMSDTGTITGIRFYKAAGDAGSHTGTLWNADGTQLATVTFSNESTSGWQTATLSTPISVASGSSYIVSYHTSGVYAYTSNYFTSDKVNGDITAPASTFNGGNGLYAYGSGTQLPVNTYNAANYWVDVIFNESTENALPVAVNDGGFIVERDTALTITASSLLANDSDADGDPLTVTAVSGATNGVVSLNAFTGAITFTPTAGYTGAASFTYTASDGTGVSSATVTMSVRPPDTSVGLFASTETPAVLANNDPSGVELGMRFTVSADGEITGLQYYKSAQDTGTHVGSLWTTSGVLLARATFVGESASGWQTVAFDAPVQVTAGTTLVASYHSNGNYASTTGFFSTDHVSGSLAATGGSNGVYAYGATSSFPTGSYQNTNYWVDITFQQTTVNSAPVAVADSGFETEKNTPIILTASSLLANDTDAGGGPLTITSVSGALNGAVTFDQATNSINFAPSAGYAGAASFNYTIADADGASSSAAVSLFVNPASDEQRLFDDQTPTMVAVNDTQDVELGMRFTTDSPGSITGVYFYKSAQNVGPHEAHLWSSTGELLASATFTNETANGWQYVDLAQDLAVDANTTYVVSYHTEGYYSATPNAFGSAFENGALNALSAAQAGGNGVFAYGDSGLFPTSSYNSANYFVDVSFRPQLVA